MPPSSLTLWGLGSVFRRTQSQATVPPTFLAGPLAAGILAGALLILFLLNGP